VVVVDNQDVLVDRRERPTGHSFSLLPDIYVERGTIDDWKLLHELHYKAENLGIGPSIYRCVLNGNTIGVGVMTVPKMLSSGRNELFAHLRPNQNGRDTPLMNRHRAKWINEHTCTNSRLVLDTMYRGVGIAYRMQNIMMRMTGKQLIEFQSSMSKFNPFAAKAGIQFTKPKRASSYGKGLQWFRRWFESNPSDFLGVWGELNAMPEKVKEKCIAEMRAFYYSCSSMEKSGDNRLNGTSRVDSMEVGYLLKSLQQLTLASPLYGVYRNPDAGVVLPDRISIMAFDRQAVDQPLVLE
jgi:ABC-type ATPase with predicted acetyltransferase domain